MVVPLEAHGPWYIRIVAPKEHLRRGEVQVPSNPQVHVSVSGCLVESVVDPHVEHSREVHALERASTAMPNSSTVYASRSMNARTAQQLFGFAFPSTDLFISRCH